MRQNDALAESRHPKGIGAKAMAEPVKDTILLHLFESIERLHQDLDKVELWLGALGSFQKPVPDYQPSDRYLLPSERRGAPHRGANPK